MEGSGNADAARERIREAAASTVRLRKLEAQLASWLVAQRAELRASADATSAAHDALLASLHAPRVAIGAGRAEGERARDEGAPGALERVDTAHCAPLRSPGAQPAAFPHIERAIRVRRAAHEPRSCAGAGAGAGADGSDGARDGCGPAQPIAALTSRTFALPSSPSSPRGAGIGDDTRGSSPAADVRARARFAALSRAAFGRGDAPAFAERDAAAAPARSAPSGGDSPPLARPRTADASAARARDVLDGAVREWRRERAARAAVISLHARRAALRRWSTAARASARIEPAAIVRLLPPLGRGTPAARQPRTAEPRWARRWRGRAGAPGAQRLALRRWRARVDARRRGGVRACAWARARDGAAADAWLLAPARLLRGFARQEWVVEHGRDRMAAEWRRARVKAATLVALRRALALSCDARAARAQTDGGVVAPGARAQEEEERPVGEAARRGERATRESASAATASPLRSLDMACARGDGGPPTASPTALSDSAGLADGGASPRPRGRRRVAARAHDVARMPAE
ncbi:hypothetical protein KFE25_007319 [Diacronema lutheri]|uniref:Uncharacterized protein n=1 Tax=Diacronema lutheri TaxID=2081491 RepID=A0A8J6CF66_DIALT|nr:hypothetical protein KFE25_007319 [Diacronema lutheri]